MQKSGAVDVDYPEITATSLAFGSCHKNKAVKPNHPVIWDAIAARRPDAFLWTGDAVYAPKKTGIAPVEMLEIEFDQMLNNETIGYKSFLSKGKNEGFLQGGVHGTWDDHDYGANDFGIGMPNREERQDLFLNFLGVEDVERRGRNGVYYSMSIGKIPRKTKVIFLDTRSSRSKHCIPSVGAIGLPFGLGSPIACITRWLSARLNLQQNVPHCRNGKVLDEQQWQWLEEQVAHTDAQVNIIVSSIQVLTTNPLMETWGQFPAERDRLLKLLNTFVEKSVILLSGDVHHAEIADSSRSVGGSSGRIIEATSSGMTHSCKDPFYGFLCEPILEKFPSHRFHNGMKSSYYTGKNFGSIEIDWAEPDKESDRKMKINIHNQLGDIVLSTGSLPFSAYESHMSSRQVRNIRGPVDGGLNPFIIRGAFGIFLILTSLTLRKFLFVKAFEEVSRQKKKTD